jgi:hypothetical protein
MFIGLDVHKQYCYATMIDSKGRIVSEGKLLNTLFRLLKITLMSNWARLTNRH